MKRVLLLSAVTGMMIVLVNLPAIAQVGVNDDNSSPDGTSMLDVKSTTRGVLIPRMTIAQRDAIAGPAKGLMVFCTDNSQFYYNAGTPASTNWVMMNTQWLSNGTNIYFSSGNVGIGTTDPQSRLEVAGDLRITYPGTGNGIYSTGSTGQALAYLRNDFAGNATGLSAGCNSASAGTQSYGVYGFNNGTGYGVYGTSSTGTGVYGVHATSFNYGKLGMSLYGVYGEYPYYGNSGYLGGANYGAQGSLGYSPSVGNYAVYGEGVHSYTSGGTGYGYTSTMGGVKGYNINSATYTFAVAGYSPITDIRSGATFGGNSGGGIWGCMGYKSSTYNNYGGYFTSQTTGTGKEAQPMIGNGIGAWGDLFGADIHGKVYGIYSEGADYASYANGTVFKNGMDVHLQKQSDGKNIALYTNVSTDMTIQTCGFATLASGSCRVNFDPSFSAAISAGSPIIVTVTPMGKTEGVYLSEVSPAGFSVAENHDGKSSVQVSYIAVGKRAGFENPVLPEAVVAGDYLEKLNAGLHNDADTKTNGVGLWYENGQLHNGISH